MREIVTGQCVAILGKITPTGLFELLDWTVPEPAPKQNIKIESESAVIGFGGDFRFGDEMAPNNLTLELLSNFITCAAGEANEQTGKISRFSIAGIVATGNFLVTFRFFSKISIFAKILIFLPKFRFLP